MGYGPTHTRTDKRTIDAMKNTISPKLFKGENSLDKRSIFLEIGIVKMFYPTKNAVRVELRDTRTLKGEPITWICMVATPFLTDQIKVWTKFKGKETVDKDTGWRAVIPSDVVTCAVQAIQGDPDDKKAVAHFIHMLGEEDYPFEVELIELINGQSSIKVKNNKIELVAPTITAQGLSGIGEPGPQGPEGIGYRLHSNTELTTGQGTHVLTVDKNANDSAFHTGDLVTVVHDNNEGWMSGYITDYTGTTLTVFITIAGTGTFNSWDIGITGFPGESIVGPQGPPGEPASLENINTQINSIVPGMISAAINAAGAALIEMIVPVGTIITSDDGTNPGTRIPGTTWVPEAEGKFIIGVGGTYANGATGGAETVTLVVNNLPSHKHNVSITSSGSGTSGSGGGGNTGSDGDGNTGGTGSSTNSTGAHNHILKMQLHGASGTDKYNAYASGDYESLGAVQSGGAHSHTVNSHTHTMPAHTHTVSAHTHTTPNHSHTVTEDNVGSAAPISIMPPYISRYKWRRTA